MPRVSYFYDGSQDWPLEPTFMTPGTFAQRIQEEFNEGGTDDGHANADAIMCELLMALGYEEGVMIFNAHDKWYS